MQELAIQVKIAPTRPKRDILAAAVLQRCREFYEDPENERAFQEWLAERNGKHESAGIEPGE